MKYNTKIAINGQIDNDYKIGFTYPKPFDPARFSSEDEWLKSLTDPRIARPFNSDKIFVYWKNELGNYYSLIIPNTLDARDGKLMLTIFTGKYIITSGKSVIEALSKLRDGLIPNLKYLTSWQSNPDFFNRIDIILSDLESSYSDDNYSSLNQTKSNNAYRTYSSQEELEKIIQFPNQVEYDIYKRILIVPQQSVPAQLPAGYEEIKSKIKKSYTISGIIPDGVKISGGKRWFNEGDTIMLTYSKSGYIDIPIQVVLDGTTNAYIRYEGTTIHLKSPKEIDEIRFHRGLKLEFKSDKGTIQDVLIGYNGQTKQHKSGKLFEFDDDRNIYKLSISANGYKNVEVSISIDDILRSSEKTITLYPEEKELKIILDTDDGKKEGSVSVKVDDQLYKYLCQASTSRRPIVFKKKENNAKIDDKDRQPSKQGFLESLWDYPIFLSVIKILVGILIVYFLYCAYVLSETNNYPWPFEKNKKENIEDSSFDPVEKTTENSTGEASSEGSNPEQEDIAYLKNEDEKWTKDSIKSEKYQELYDFISEGRIDDILNKQNSEWFPDQIINGYWKKCYEILRAIKDKNDNDKLSRAQEEMKRLSKNGSIPINELSNALKLVDNPEVRNTHSEPERNNLNGKSKSDNNGSGLQHEDGTHKDGAPSTANRRPTSGR